VQGAWIVREHALPRRGQSAAPMLLIFTSARMEDLVDGDRVLALLVEPRIVGSKNAAR
jgi:hypothetical protein